MHEGPAKDVPPPPVGVTGDAAAAVEAEVCRPRIEGDVVAAVIKRWIGASSIACLAPPGITDQDLTTRSETAAGDREWPVVDLAAANVSCAEAVGLLIHVTAACEAPHPAGRDPRDV